MEQTQTLRRSQRIRNYKGPKISNNTIDLFSKDWFQQRHYLREKEKAKSSQNKNVPLYPTISRCKRLLKCVHHSPNLFIIDDFLTPKEIQHLLDLSHNNLAKFKTSYTQATSTDQIYSSERTSTFIFLQKYMDRITRTIETRAADIVSIPVGHVEQLQIVRYVDGQEFTLHHDAGTLVNETLKETSSSSLRSLSSNHSNLSCSYSAADNKQNHPLLQQQIHSNNTVNTQTSITPSHSPNVPSLCSHSHSNPQPQKQTQTQMYGQYPVQQPHPSISSQQRQSQSMPPPFFPHSQIQMQQHQYSQSQSPQVPVPNNAELYTLQQQQYAHHGAQYQQSNIYQQHLNNYHHNVHSKMNNNGQTMQYKKRKFVDLTKSDDEISPEESTDEENENEINLHEKKENLMEIEHTQSTNKLQSHCQTQHRLQQTQFTMNDDDEEEEDDEAKEDAEWREKNAKYSVQMVAPYRICSFFVYLTTLPEGSGGETYFPKLDIKVRPERGKAILWCNVDPNNTQKPDPMLIHRARPVNGNYEKIGMNIWINDCSIDTSLV